MKFNVKSTFEKIFGDKDFIKMTLYLFFPVALQSLVTICVTYVDNFFIAEFAQSGTEAKTALGLVSPILLIPQSILIGFLTGAGVMTAQYYGKNDLGKIKETILFKLLLGFIIGVIFMAVMMTSSEGIVNIVSISSNTTTKNFAKIYLFWSGLSMVPLGIAFALEFSMKDTKQPFIPLIAATIAMISNVILDPIFIMDSTLSDEEKIRNIAITTCLARSIEAGFILIWLAFKKGNSNYFYDCKRISKEVIKKIMFFGYQIIINESLFGFINAFFIIATFHYNPELEDAMTTYALLTQFTSLVWPSTAAVCSVVVGSELGKSNFERAKYNSRKAINWSFVLSAIIGSVILISTLFINEILSPEASPEMLDLTKKIEYILVPIVFIQGPYSIIYYSLRSGGSKYLIFVDGITSLAWTILISVIVYVPGIKEHITPIWFIVLLELDNIIRLSIASIAYKYSNWSNDLTVEKVKPKKLQNNL